MLEKEINVLSSLEARPASLFVQTASQFSSDIKVKIDDKIVNAKSIMGIISLGIIEGQVITIIANGEDEEKAVDAIEKFIKSL